MTHVFSHNNPESVLFTGESRQPALGMWNTELGNQVSALIKIRTAMEILNPTYEVLAVVVFVALLSVLDKGAEEHLRGLRCPDRVSPFTFTYVLGRLRSPVDVSKYNLSLSFVVVAMPSRQ